MRKIVLYALEGAWNTGSVDGCQVLAIDENKEVLQNRLGLIAESQAGEYVMGHVWDGISEERRERHYEIRDDTGSWAQFNVTEHNVDISETLMGAIGREMEKVSRIKDIQEYLRSLYGSGDIEPGMPEDDEMSAGKTVPADGVRKAAYRIHKAGGCDAADSYSKGYDDAITLALDIIMEETGFGISEILDYGECD
ncbi:MAG TPA: hypothetical protein DCZ91_01895 [Lachnospiraceae bacterium]|nr:hypothetical protein [Lachnospiraceae bacterium]